MTQKATPPKADELLAAGKQVEKLRSYLANKLVNPARGDDRDAICAELFYTNKVVGVIQKYYPLFSVEESKRARATEIPEKGAEPQRDPRSGYTPLRGVVPFKDGVEWRRHTHPTEPHKKYCEKCRMDIWLAQEIPLGKCRNNADCPIEQWARDKGIELPRPNYAEVETQ